MKAQGGRLVRPSALIAARRAEIRPSSQLLTQTQYKKLLADLRRIMGEGEQEAERAYYEVRDVIDADTLLLDIDLGFEVIRRQSIRLARIERTLLKGRYLNQELVDKGFAKVV
jgi:hypothetical protein